MSPKNTMRKLALYYMRKRSKKEAKQSEKDAKRSKKMQNEAKRCETKRNKYEESKMMRNEAKICVYLFRKLMLKQCKTGRVSLPFEWKRKQNLSEKGTPYFGI
jgi:hypothetical protein